MSVGDCPTADAETVVSQLSPALSPRDTVKVVDSEDPAFTDTTWSSRLEVYPLQSAAWEVDSETVASSSPEFWIVMVYSAALSDVADWLVGLADKATLTDADTSGSDMVISIKVIINVTTELSLIISRNQSLLKGLWNKCISKFSFRCIKI